MPPGSGIDFAAPRRTPMGDALYQQLSEWTNLQMIYSAALAAFTLDGDSELARQYLHIAAQFPSVLIEVIGKFKEHGALQAFVSMSRIWLKVYLQLRTTPIPCARATVSKKVRRPTK